MDYTPAELKENKIWVVEYYVLNPNTNTLERKRKRVRPIKSISERRKFAKKLILEINSRLESGWNPFFENKGTRELTKLLDALEVYINRCTTEHKDGNIRFDTFRTYNSQIKLLKEYIITRLKQPEMFAYKFDEDFIGTYLDYIRYERGLSAKTRDNYLSFLTTLSTFLLKKKYIAVNPTLTYTKINRKTKQRTIIDPTTREKIFSYWDKKNPNFLTLCLVCYYCLVRRTELTKLRVKDINLEKSTLFIDSFDSKNRKSAHVTIPNKLKPILRIHLNGAPLTDYLFSAKNYAPGPEQVTPMRITKRWSYMRDGLGIAKNIHWYSLKDTGITDLLRAGVALISVRDQARHSSSAQTDEYTPRELRNADTEIKDSGIKFI